MINLENIGIKEIIHKKKELIIYGASQNLKNMINFFENEKISEYIQFIVDRDEEKDGHEFIIEGYKFPIVSLSRFLKIKDIPLKYQMIIGVERYLDVIQQLDTISALDGMQCYVWWPPFLAQHSQRTLARKIALPQLPGKYEIPKIIHYFWFGKEIPERAKKCIQSWKETCPGFEIKEWNEENYDVNSISYTKEAYEQGKFSFVSDYARYDVISRYGGFYFDTDVELLRDISPLSQYRGFFSFEYYDLINSGSGFAAQKGDEVILELRDAYHGRKFVGEDLGLNLKPCSKYETKYFEGKGIKIDNSFQIYKDFLIFPYEFFSPINQGSAMPELTRNTFGIHRFDCTWLEKEMREDWDKKKNNISSITERLIASWKINHQKK